MGGYAALEKSLFEMTPDEIIDHIFDPLLVRRRVRTPAQRTIPMP